MEGTVGWIKIVAQYRGCGRYKRCGCLAWVSSIFRVVLCTNYSAYVIFVRTSVHHVYDVLRSVVWGGERQDCMKE